MNIKDAAFTVSEKSSNTCNSDTCSLYNYDGDTLGIFYDQLNIRGARQRLSYFII